MFKIIEKASGCDHDITLYETREEAEAQVSKSRKIWRCCSFEIVEVPSEQHIDWHREIFDEGDKFDPVL